MLQFRQVSKITRSSGWKYLRHRLLVFPGYIIAVIEEITAHILSVALSRLLGPFMVLGSVIHDKVHAHIHILPVALVCQCRQILHGTKLRFHLSEIRHRITAVRAAFRRIQKGHEMYAVYITRLQIIQFFLYALQISCKIIKIEHHAQHIVFLKPVRIFLSLFIPVFQTCLSRLIIFIHLRSQLSEHFLISV